MILAMTRHWPGSIWDFLIDNEEARSSIYMTNFGVCLYPWREDLLYITTALFHGWKNGSYRLLWWLYTDFIKKGNALGQFPGNISTYPITGHPLLFYSSFVVPKFKSGSYRWILIASCNRRAPSLNDRILNYTTSFVGLKESLVPWLGTRFMFRIDLRKAFKKLSRAVNIF